MAQRLSSLATRAKVKFGAFHGVPIVWIVADKNHSGYPDNSVTLLSNQILRLLCFDANEVTAHTDRAKQGNNRYLESNLRQWLNSTAAAGAWFSMKNIYDAPPSKTYTQNGTNAYDAITGFLNTFSAKERAALLDTTITAATSDVDNSTKSDTLTDKVFVLSRAEVGLLGDTVHGVLLPIFTDAASRIATVTAECVANSAHYTTPASGAAWSYWLRDAYEPILTYSNYVASGGTLASTYASMENVGLRPACNLSGDLMVSDTTDASGAYTIIYNEPPTMPGSITVPDEVRGGSNTTISWGSSTDPDGNFSGYILEQKVDAGAWAQIYKGASRTFSAPITRGWATVQYRVKAYDTVGAESAYATSAIRTVINNQAPVISGSDADLGTFSNTAPSAQYTVTDADGDQVTVVEKLDGVLLKQYTVTLGATNTLAISTDAWRRLLNGSHAMTITATDANGASSTRTLTFTKAVPSIQLEQALAMAANEMPIKALVNIQGSFPTGSELKVWICNNGNDAAPAWEEITQKALTGNKHFFNNKTKTSDAWGVKIKVELNRGTATGPCYIQSIGGNFG